jgi:small ligand-binding sensory domain FIST
MRFSAGVSKASNPVEAGRALCAVVREQLAGSRADLACLFVSPHFAEHADALVRAVDADLSPRHLIGCTGEGIIAGAEEIEDAPAAALWAAELPAVTIAPVRLRARAGGDSLSLDHWPAKEPRLFRRPTFLLLADPFSTPMDEVLALIANCYPGSPAIGGLAGGGREAGENRLLLGVDVFDEGLVGVSLEGPVAIRTVVSQGCRPIGDRFVVTRAEQNIIHELGGAPALEQLQKVFQGLSEEEQRLAQRALHIGLAMDERRNRFERGDFLVRNLIGVDQRSGSLAIGDLPKEGQTVQFQVRDAQSATEDLHLLLASERLHRGHVPGGALMFLCCGRGAGLFGRPHHDASVLRERAGTIPVSGFFAQGEIGPVGGNNYLHGYTASVALFSEPEIGAKGDRLQVRG